MAWFLHIIFIKYLETKRKGYEKTTMIYLLIILMVLTVSTISAQSGTLSAENYMFFTVATVIAGTSDQPPVLIDFPMYHYDNSARTLTSYEIISVTDTTQVVMGSSLSLSGEVGGGTSSRLSSDNSLILDDVYNIDTNGTLEYNLNGTWITLAAGQTYTETLNMTKYNQFTGNLEVTFTVRNLGIWKKANIIFPTASPTPVPSTEIIGDVNNDGAINIVDALLLAQNYVGISLSNFDAPLADVNVDDVVNIIDALLVAQYYVGLVTELPVEVPGGYSQISVSSDNALTAYNFLADDVAVTQPDITLGDVRLAFSQVVAGMNVRLVCYYSATNGDHYLSAVIFFNTEMVAEQVSSLKLDIY